MEFEEPRNIELPAIYFSDEEGKEEEENEFHIRFPKKYIRDGQNPFNI